ncbi:hypothetical protein BDV19DRAFT_354051 [Aspergillus venezuelensis]
MRGSNVHVQFDGSACVVFVVSGYGLDSEHAELELGPFSIYPPLCPSNPSDDPRPKTRKVRRRSDKTAPVPRKRRGDWRRVLIIVFRFCECMYIYSMCGMVCGIVARICSMQFVYTLA